MALRITVARNSALSDLVIADLGIAFNSGLSFKPVYDNSGILFPDPWESPYTLEELRFSEDLRTFLVDDSQGPGDSSALIYTDLAGAVVSQIAQSETMAFLNSLSDPRTKPYATSNPTVSDDWLHGFDVGSTWINTSTEKEFLCTDRTTGAAVWKEIGFVGESGRGGLLVFTRSGVVTSGTFLFVGNVASSASGPDMIRPMTITGVSARVDTSSTFDVEIVDEALSVLATLSVVADTDGRDDSLSVDIAAGKTIAARSKAGSSNMRNPVVTVEMIEQ